MQRFIYAGICYLVCLGLPLQWSEASEGLVELKLEGTSSKKSSTGVRQEIVNQKILEVSSRYIKEIIGESRFNDRFSLIHNKIIKQSGKYISYIRSGTVKKVPDGWSMGLSMTLSLDSLRAALLKQGLLYDLKSSLKILPMVSFMNSVKLQQMSWWGGSRHSVFLEVLSKEFEEQFKQAVFLKGFFSLSPSEFNLYHSIPENLRSQGALSSASYSEEVARQFQSVLVLKGRFNLLPSTSGESNSYKINVNLEIVNTNNGRVMASIFRSYNTDSGPFQQVIHSRLRKIFKEVSALLSGQLYGFWQKGTFGTKTIRLVLRGRLKYIQLNRFNKLVLKKLSNVRAVRERLFTPKGVVYELDMSTSGRGLASQIEKKKWPSFQVSVLKVLSDQVEVRVRPN